MFVTRSATRAFIVLISFALLSAVFVMLYGTAFYEKDLPFGFYNALVLLSFSTLISESYFTKPNDVIANATALLVLLIPLSAEITLFKPAFYALNILALLAIVCAVVSNSLFDPDGGAGVRRHQASLFFKAVAVAIGSGRAMFGATAILLLFNMKAMPNEYFASALVFVFAFLVFDIARLSDRVRRSAKTKQIGGKIIGVQADNLAVATSPGGKPAIGQPAQLRLADELLAARVVSHHRLHDEGRTLLSIRERLPSNEYDIKPGEYVLLPESEDADKMVGLVNAATTVSSLKFRQLSGTSLETGAIVSCSSGLNIYYQIQDAKLVQDELAGEDATDFVEVTAAQLGRWNAERGYFERFGWVPPMYADVVVPKTYPAPTKKAGEVEIGTIPNTTVPVFLNADEAVTHHTAVLGVTGVGKSVFVRNLIRTLASSEMKFICVDLTREYVSKFGSAAGLLVSEQASKVLSKKVNELGAELSKFRNNQDAQKLFDLKKAIVEEFTAAIKNFVEIPERKIAILELGDLDGSIENLEFLKWFFRSIFLYARARPVKEPRICLVLEEAHTIVPEWNFMGSDDRSAGNVVNNIAQVALQGRKYGVGLVVVAQRTASVSKTVLTQCNTVIAFQQFDKTSFDFL